MHRIQDNYYNNRPWTNNNKIQVKINNYNNNNN